MIAVIVIGTLWAIACFSLGWCSAAAYYGPRIKALEEAAAEWAQIRAEVDALKQRVSR